MFAIYDIYFGITEDMESADVTAAAPYAGQLLTVGSSGIEVERLQYYISVISGVYTEIRAPAIDGIFGPEVEEAVSRRFAKYGIVSCDGLHMERGIFSTIADMEQFLGKAFRKNCEKLVLLADHTKFNKVYYYRYMEMKDVDIIVTDDSPGEEWEEFLESHHIELLY